ncbi:MAG: glycosyl hydrolase [Candidatus Thorarchaeota archaeon]|nr:MAG: glycosyl hydrolase [Candidatus Thorarchaeota archaeon]
MSVTSTKNKDLDIHSKVEQLVRKLTLEEKFLLLSNHNEQSAFSSTPIGRLGIPSLEMTDGPLGVSWHSSNRRGTRFPATICLSATWDRNLSQLMGEAIGREAREAGKRLLLAPGVNIHRTPLNGRTFEYMSEDPYLTKEIAIPYVRGVQKQGVGACLKHFAANNQETNRRTSSSEIDERTLHEIYLRPFKEIVQEAEPWSIMGSYNKINGKYVYENTHLLRRVLMKEWGFDGFVLTDWDATEYMHDAAICIKSGLSLEMPRPHCYRLELLRASFEKGEFTESMLDDVVGRFLRIFFLTGILTPKENSDDKRGDSTQHPSLARRIAEEGLVLLKNDRMLLPLRLQKTRRIALLGPNLDVKFGRPQYGGSSAVVPPYEITPLQGIRERSEGNIDLVNDASNADIAVIFAGLNHDKGKDSESEDRESFDLPQDQAELIKKTAQDNADTIVILISGSPIGMEDWLREVPTVLEAWYPGMEGGRAIANVLFGDVNPSGKLPITFPRRLRDSPAHSGKGNRTYPGDENLKVHYEEGINVGYRFFDTMSIEPNFPFGFGMSYTSFEYQKLRVDKKRIKSMKDHLVVSIDITNSGPVNGSEVIQVYASQNQSEVQRPLRELVGFEKIMLRPRQTSSLSVTVQAKDLAYYDGEKHRWRLAAGEVELHVGSSSRCDFLSETIVCYED